MPHVVLLEDDPLVRTLLTHRMLRNGWRVSALADARGLDALLEAGLPDLIVVDIGLPHLDGLAVVEDLRARGLTVPVLVLTAYEQPHLIAAVRSAGADDLVQKPCDNELLLERMQRLMAA